MQLRIKTDIQSPRLDYSLELIFKQLLGISYELVDESAHLSYSSQKAGGLHIKPHGLLSEKGIRAFKEEVHFEAFGNSQASFRTDSEDCPFDLFAATFFLCSRYEEYWDYYPDEHQRFTARESVLNSPELMREPLVNQWALWLKEALLVIEPQLSFKPRRFEYLSTIDIDQAWKYKNKGLKRNLMGFFRDAIAGKWENFWERWPVLWGIKPDPFYNFDLQDSLHQRFKTRVKYFFLLGDLGGYDKNIHWQNSAQKKLIKGLESKEHYELGIHPSYQSNQAGELHVKAEIKRLETIIGSKVRLSRQHFLMHQFPKTYDTLLALGIKEEHSMGYSSHLGFRAGIAAPFPYYQFESEQTTDLILYPFCFMDVTPMHYMQQSPAEAKEECTALMEKVKSVGGLFVSLWHNESLSETERWKNWRSLYPFMLEQASKS